MYLCSCRSWLVALSNVKGLRINGTATVADSDAILLLEIAWACCTILMIFIVVRCRPVHVT